MRNPYPSQVYLIPFWDLSWLAEARETETHSPAATPMLFSPPVHPDSVKALMNASVAADPMVSAPTTTEIEKRMFAWLN